MMKRPFSVDDLVQLLFLDPGIPDCDGPSPIQVRPPPPPGKVKLTTKEIPNGSVLRATAS
jgi:hypothetical protein